MDIVTLRLAFRDLQRKYDMQALKLSELQQQARAETSINLCQAVACTVSQSTSPRNQTHSTSVRVEQACQTEERAFTDQLDAIFRESASKAKELRRIQETLQTVRAEARQEKLMADQFRSQVEVLEEQLQVSLQKQHRAEMDRTFADRQLRNSTAERPSSSSMPQPRKMHARRAWAEGFSEHSPEISNQVGSTEHLGKVRSEGFVQDDESELGASSGSESDSLSDGKEDFHIFHPPASARR
jgi:hypothetical protein